ncbi:MAG: hypothetical protein H7233_07620 [Pseudorhodobacter sp.]|nr:hypothetical protein [Frankiaceae bacterium]
MPRTPEGVAFWCYVCQVGMGGYRSREPGQHVCSDYEMPGQDGSAARVLTSVTPAR